MWNKINEILNLDTSSKLYELMLIKENYFLATISLSSSGNDSLWFVSEGGILRKGTGKKFGIRPIITLKSSIKVIGGSGIKEDPYKISN